MTYITALLSDISGALSEFRRLREKRRTRIRLG
jgi:hypothetical protein